VALLPVPLNTVEFLRCTDRVSGDPSLFASLGFLSSISDRPRLPPGPRFLARFSISFHLMFRHQFLFPPPQSGPFNVVWPEIPPALHFLFPGSTSDTSSSYLFRGLAYSLVPLTFPLENKGFEMLDPGLIFSSLPPPLPYLWLVRPSH